MIEGPTSAKKKSPFRRFQRKRAFEVRITSLRVWVCLWWLRLWPGQYNTLLVVLAAIAYIVLAYQMGYNRFYTAWTVVIAFFIARLITIRFNWRSRPVNEFEMRHVLEGVTGWIPGWKKGEEEGEGEEEQGR